MTQLSSLLLIKVRRYQDSHTVLFPCLRWLQETDIAMVMQRQNPRAGNKWNYVSGNWCHRHSKLLWVSVDSNKNWISENTLPNMRRYLTTWQVFCDNSDPLFLQTVQGIIYLCDEGDVSMGRCIARICWDKHHYRYSIQVAPWGTYENTYMVAQDITDNGKPSSCVPVLTHLSALPHLATFMIPSKLLHHQ